MRSVLVFLLLYSIRLLSRLIFRLRGEWIGQQPDGHWDDVRLMVFLNHTSLYEPLFAGFAPNRLLWHFARHGVLPVADKTMRRKVGIFFSFLARHVVVVTRQRDQSWDKVLNRVDREAIVMILPEGRMMRKDGLDSKGRPMSVRGGVADILKVLSDGRLLLVYSGGLHHIQAPGELVPRPLRTIRARIELADIAKYKASLGGDAELESFRTAVIGDLTHRRNTICPTLANGEVQGGELPRYRPVS